MYGYWVHIFSIKSISSSIYWTLRQGDLSRGGTRTVEQFTTDFVDKIMQIDEAEQKWIKNQVAIQEELNREFQKYILNGHQSFLLGQKGNSSSNKKKVKRQYFVNLKTGEKRTTMPKEFNLAQTIRQS